MELSPRMALFRYDDVPGVIGRIGTLIGEAGVNIANMAVSRTNRGDKALMAVSLDTSGAGGSAGRTALREAGSSTTSSSSTSARNERASGPRRWSAGPPTCARWAARHGSRSSRPGTASAVDAARAVGCKPGEIVKSLVVAAAGKPGRRARARRQARRLREDRAGGRRGKAKIASPEQVERATGFVAGAVAPFPLPRGRPRPRRPKPALAQARLDRRRLSAPHGRDRPR